jgi:hypothetical protein
MLNVIMLKFVMLSILILSVPMPNVIIPNDVTQSVVMLSAVALNTTLSISVLSKQPLVSCLVCVHFLLTGTGQLTDCQKLSLKSKLYSATIAHFTVSVN